jgi:hypothetical protein
LTLGRAIAPKCFYAFGDHWSFHTAKTQLGHGSPLFIATHADVAPLN